MCAVDIRFTFAKLPESKKKIEEEICKGRTLPAEFCAGSKNQNQKKKTDSSCVHMCGRYLHKLKKNSIVSSVLHGGLMSF